MHCCILYLVTLRLNRKQTTTKKLVMDFTTLITKDINRDRVEDDNDFASSWALIRRGTAGRVQTALEGSKVILECSVIASDPQVKVEWMLPDLSVVEDKTDKIDVSEKGQLVILNATLSDSGLYHCIVRTRAGVDLISLRLTIKERSLSGMKITYGLNLNLPCTVDGWPQASIAWTLPNGVVLDKPQTIGRISFFANGTLQLRQMATFDKGTYICKASNSFGSSALSYPVTVMVFPPRITSTMTSITRLFVMPYNKKNYFMEFASLTV
uniref:Ig-like domain-containing protein n=1 Tax=Amphilophus citrinellus TaxID=61819 RepID=A0A3Q0T4Q3_AMPCI